MKFFEKPYVKIVAVILVFVFTFILRAHNYDREPEIGHLEEMLYGWAGINLIETGVPMSWSTLDYPDSAQVYKGEMSLNGSNPKHFVTLQSPWLDEPPLYSIISGGTAHLFGADRSSILPSAYIRLPQIFISFLISVFVYLIARKLSGIWTAVIAVLIYGATPIFVFGSRLAVPENLIALIFMIVIFGILKLREKSSIFLIILLPVLIGLGGISKPTGFLLAPLLIYELYLKKYYKSIGLTVIIVAIFIIAFIGYGLYFNSEIFWYITQIQSTRPIGFGALGFLLSTPSYDIFPLYDTFYVFCMVSFIYYIFSSGIKKEDQYGVSFLVFAGVYWLIIVIMSGGERDLLGWYRFGLFPLLPIFGAWMLKECVQHLSFIKSVFLISLFLGNRYFLINPFRPGIESMPFRIIFSALILPSLGYEAFRKSYFKLLGQAIIIGAFIVGIYINSIYIYNAHELKCERRECPIGPSTPISRLHFPLLWRFFVLPPSQISNPKGFHFGRQYD